MAYRINAEKLLSLMKEDHHWGKALKTGYQENEAYFEFGVLPISLPFVSKQGVWLLLNHHFDIYFMPTPTNKGDFVVCPSDDKAGTKHNLISSSGCETCILYISTTQWEQCRQEAEMIRNDYSIVRGGFFISIPNKWYEETNIIKIVNQLYPVVPRPAKSRFPFGFMEN